MHRSRHLRLFAVDEAPSAGPPLSDDDAREMARLLARYADHELDQFDHWSLTVPGWGMVYIAITLEKPSDMDESLYTRIWPLPPKLAN
jgi:hypothetical protein